MNILFDLDGTIIDPGQGIINSYSKALIELGFGDKINDDMSWVIGPPLRKSFAEILPASIIETAVSKYREIHALGGLTNVRLYDGITHVISSLKSAGHDLYICTAKNIPFATKNIEQFNLRPYFNEIYGSHLDGTFDDKGDLIEHILNTNNIDSKETIMIGDRQHDIKAAKRNNVKSIAVLWGYGSVAELNAAGADIIIDNPADILVQLLKMP